MSVVPEVPFTPLTAIAIRASTGSALEKSKTNSLSPDTSPSSALSFEFPSSNIIIVGVTTPPSVMVIRWDAEVAVHPVGNVAPAKASVRVSFAAMSERALTVSVGADVPVGSVHVLPLRVPPETESL